MRAAYNSTRPTGFLAAPPFEEWRGISDICGHPYCRCVCTIRRKYLPLFLVCVCILLTAAAPWPEGLSLFFRGVEGGEEFTTFSACAPSASAIMQAFFVVGLDGKVVLTSEGFP